MLGGQDSPDERLLPSELTLQTRSSPPRPWQLRACQEFKRARGGSTRARPQRPCVDARVGARDAGTRPGARADNAARAAPPPARSPCVAAGTLTDTRNSSVPT